MTGSSHNGGVAATPPIVPRRVLWVEKPVREERIGNKQFLFYVQHCCATADAKCLSSTRYGCFPPLHTTRIMHCKLLLGSPLPFFYRCLFLLL